MPNYTITNRTKSPRVVYGSSGRMTPEGKVVTGNPVIIQPGQSRLVPLSDKAAERYRNRGGGLRVDDHAPEVDGEITPEPQGQVIQTNEPEDVSKARARELINNVDEMHYGEWSAQAREALGDRWPGGTPKKAAILELLMAAN